MTVLPEQGMVRVQNHLVFDRRLATDLTGIIVTLKDSGSQTVGKIKWPMLIVFPLRNILTCLHSFQQSWVKLTDFYRDFLDWSNGTDILDNLFLRFRLVP